MKPMMNALIGCELIQSLATYFCRNVGASSIMRRHPIRAASKANIGSNADLSSVSALGRKRLLANNANELPVEAGELETPDARLLTVSFLADFASRFSHPLESDL